jgi:hypothetical protein
MREAATLKKGRRYMRLVDLADALEVKRQALDNWTGRSNGLPAPVIRRGGGTAMLIEAGDALKVGVFMLLAQQFGPGCARKLMRGSEIEAEFWLTDAYPVSVIVDLEPITEAISKIRTELEL